MKYAIAADAVAALFAVSPAAAQDGGLNYYGSVGYQSIDLDGASLGAVNGRVGMRNDGMGLGIEVEGAAGVDDDVVGLANVELKSQYGIYAVAFLPASDSFELLGRIGYGRTNIEVSGVEVGDDSFNWGVGAQWFFKGGSNGLRGEWTRYELDGADDSDAFTFSFVHRFGR